MRINACECFYSFLITHFTLFLTSKLKISISGFPLGDEALDFRYLITWGFDP